MLCIASTFFSWYFFVCFCFCLQNDYIDFPSAKAENIWEFSSTDFAVVFSKTFVCRIKIIITIINSSELYNLGGQMNVANNRKNEILFVKMSFFPFLLLSYGVNTNARKIYTFKGEFKNNKTKKRL